MALQSLTDQPPSANVLGANDRLTIGVIGLGLSGGFAISRLLHHIAEESKISIEAVCDVYKKRRDEAPFRVDVKRLDSYVDYRALLDRKDIDAIVVATHDPLHAQISLDALDAGKHVYCERPLTRHLHEAFKVFDKVKSTGKVFQLGEQGCSAEGWHKCAELVQNGKIGELVCSRRNYCTHGGPGCDGCRVIESDFNPAEVDWSKWLGPLKPRPFNAAHFHQWRMFPDYSAGLLASQATSRLLPLILASGRPEFPLRVNCISGQICKPRHVQAAPGEALVPGHVHLVAEFPGGHIISITCSWMNAKSPGNVIHGHKATLLVGNMGERIELVPEKEFEGEVRPESLVGLQSTDMALHLKNWIDCIRSGKQPNANIDLTIRAQTVLSLAEMSSRLSVTCLFDERTRKVRDGTGKEITPLTYPI